jgi:hypothetical protein
MFAVGIYGVSLSDFTQKAFEVELAHYYDDYPNNVSVTTVIPMVPCTPEHLNFNSEIQEQYG